MLQVLPVLVHVWQFLMVIGVIYYELLPGSRLQLVDPEVTMTSEILKDFEEVFED